MAVSLALVARLLGERYEGRPPWGVTQRWLPGGMSPRGDRSPEGATPAGRGGALGWPGHGERPQHLQGLQVLHRARV